MNKGSIEKYILKGFFWSFSGRISYMLVGFITNVILARTLGPEIFGQVAIVLFFITISKVLVESGLSGALIRKNKVSDRDYSTVLIFNIVASIFIILFIFFLAQPISDFYDTPIIKDLLIFSSMILLIDSLRIVQDTKLIRNLDFKKKSIYEFSSILFSSLVGIVLAFNGFGVWSIIIMNIITVLTLTSLLWIFEGNIHFNSFSMKSFKSLYKFGLNTTLSLLLVTFFDNIYQIIIGKYFSLRQTGLYYNSKRLQEIPIAIVQSTTMGVSYSSLSKLKNNKNDFEKLYLEIRTLFTIFIGFIVIFIFYYAENIIVLFYGLDWIDSTYFIRILIIISFFYSQEMFNRMIFKVFDRTDKILKLEIIKKTIQSLTIIIGIIFLNIKILLIGMLSTTIISYIINSIELRKVFSNLIWKDMLLVAKISFSCISSVLLCTLLEIFFVIKGYNTFFLLPVLIINYLFFVDLLKIFDLRKNNLTIYRKYIISILKKNDFEK